MNRKLDWLHGDQITYFELCALTPETIRDQNMQETYDMHDVIIVESSSTQRKQTLAMSWKLSAIGET